jgi:hypothetical protein
MVVRKKGFLSTDQSEVVRNPCRAIDSQGVFVRS